MEIGSTAQEAERYVLSAWMLSVDAVWESLAIMTVHDFAEIRHEILAETIIALANDGKPTDPIAVTDALGERKDLDHVGAGYVFDLNGYALTAANVGYYAAIVHENGRRRAMLQAGDIVKSYANDMSLSSADMLERAREVIDRAAGLDTELVDETSDVLVDDVVSKIGTEEPAYRTPWPKVSSAMRGLKKGGLYIVAARPGVGKSVVALQMATALETQGFVGFFTLEMPKHEVIKRLIAQQTELSYALIDGGRKLPDYAEQRVAEWRAQYDGRILIDDRPGRSILDMRAQVRTWHRKYPMTGIVIDYAQLITGGERGQSRVDVVGEISRQAKLMAREFDLPVILLSQLNRKSEDRADKMPAMSDLRESGSLEQDADVIILLHRDMSLSNDPREEAFIDFIIAKNRQGQTGKIELVWEGEFMRATGGRM